MSAAGREPPDNESGPVRRERLGLSRERMARIPDTSTKTVERWQAHSTMPDAAARERLNIVARIVDLGLVVYSLDGFQRFLTVSIGRLRAHPAPTCRSRTG